MSDWADHTYAMIAGPRLEERIKELELELRATRDILMTVRHHLKSAVRQSELSAEPHVYRDSGYSIVDGIPPRGIVSYCANLLWMLSCSNSQSMELTKKMFQARQAVIEVAILMRNANLANSKHLEDCLPCQTNNDCKEGMALSQAFVDSQIALDGAIEEFVAEERAVSNDHPS